MSHPSYTLLHKQDWDKLKKKSKTKEKSKPKDECIKKLVEKSQTIVNTWPASIEACAKGLEEQRENRHKENAKLIKAFSEKLSSKNKTLKEIKKARQSIFDNSCYGQRLWSSIFTTVPKVVEERASQIKFNYELKRRLLKIEKEQNKLNIDEAILQQRKTLAALKIAQRNKDMETKKRELERKLKQENVKCNKIGEEIIKNITYPETQQKLKTKRMKKQAIEEFKTQQNQYEKSKEAQNTLDDVLTETNYKEQDRLKCKIDKFNKKIGTDKQNDTSKSKQAYKTIEKPHNQDRKTYENLIEKGVKTFEARQKADEQQRMQKLNQIKHKRVKIQESLKTGSEIVKEKPKFSERSSISLKNIKIKQKGPRKLQTEYEFKEPHVTLLDGLKKRDNEKDAATATALQESNHKHFVRQIFDDKRTLNKLVTPTLPIPDY